MNDSQSIDGTAIRGAEAAPVREPDGDAGAPQTAMDAPAWLGSMDLPGMDGDVQSD